MSLNFLNSTWSNVTYTTAFYNISRNVTDGNNTNITETVLVEVQQESSTSVSRETLIDASSPANTNARRRLAADIENVNNARRTAANMDTDNQCGGDSVCAVGVPDGTVFTFSCPGISVVDAVVFAQFGNPLGVCGSFQYGPCSSTFNATIVVEGLCLGRSSCVIPVSSATFGNETGECDSRSFRSLNLQLNCGSPVDLATDVGISIVISEDADIDNATQSLADLYRSPGLFVSQFGSFSFALGNCTGAPFNLSSAVAGQPTPVITYYRSPTSNLVITPSSLVQLGAPMLLLLLLLIPICCCCYCYGLATFTAHLHPAVSVVHDGTHSAVAEARAIADALREKRRISMDAAFLSLRRTRTKDKAAGNPRVTADISDVDVTGAAHPVASNSTLSDFMHVWCLRVRVVSFAHISSTVRQEAERLHLGAFIKGTVPVRFVFASPVTTEGEDAVSTRTLLSAGAAVEWSAVSGALVGAPTLSPEELNSATASRVWPSLQLSSPRAVGGHRGTGGSTGCASALRIYTPP